jgi:hypothetical protein
VSRTYDKQPLFLHTKPIAFSSSREKNIIETPRAIPTTGYVQELDETIFKSGNLSHWSLHDLDRWLVGRTEGEFKNAAWHAWAAVLMWTKSSCGKCVIIYDSNSDLLPKGEVTGKHLLRKQQALITHLKNEGCKISDVWLEGMGIWNRAMVFA